MSRNLNVASALLSVVAIFAMFNALQYVFLLAPRPIEVPTVSQIRDFSPELAVFDNLMTQIRGLHLLGLSMTLLVVFLIPYRKGEKWAWYGMLVVGGIYFPPILFLLYNAPFIMAKTNLQIIIVMVIIWIVGLALPAKEILRSR
ncbi:MAG: hypothetical protein ACE5I5_20095 [Candidatus Heimdallarchaeota archaeon]